jgi:hypothetical protein
MLWKSVAALSTLAVTALGFKVSLLASVNVQIKGYLGVCATSLNIHSYVPIAITASAEPFEGL